ncbi:MAG TPA: DUF934 domain-containing protein [Usitatibacter sp.]|nr:DUF934 domain-containing protein [Usitatibacter sp.]
MLPERVIRHGHVEPEAWQFVGLEPQSTIEPLPEGPIAVPLALWKAQRDNLLARSAPVGVWLKPDDEPGDIAADLPWLDLIAVHFPKFTDGRGYSTATLLRTRYGYTGELRAFGDVGRDQLFYLKRVGFDSFALAPHRDPIKALDSFDDFTVRYQGSVDDAVPLFRKHRAGGAA